MIFWRPNWDILINKVNDWLIQHIIKPHWNCSCINGEEEEEEEEGAIAWQSRMAGASRRGKKTITMIEMTKHELDLLALDV